MESVKAMSTTEQLRNDAVHTITPDPLLGTWQNTNTSTLGIATVLLTPRSGRIVLRVFGAGPTGPLDWGETAAAVFAADPDSAEAAAFSAFYDFDFMETRLQVHLRQGVLIVAKFDRFKDSSGRSNYFSKEFFYHTED
jgi:hypothetical protein